MKQETLFKSRVLRKNQTEAEQLLWEKLRGRRLQKLRFRRQHPFPPYIVDFYCAERDLVIELDGGQHLDKREYDDERSRHLNSLGKKVLRYWNNEVLDDMDGVIETIVQQLKISQ